MLTDTHTIPRVLLLKCCSPNLSQTYRFRQIPLGIAYLAASLRQTAAVQVFDMSVDRDLPKVLNEHDPDFIGISASSADYSLLPGLVHQFRIACPKALLVAGGPHPTAMPEQVLSCGFDFVIRGEGERAIADLVKTCPDKASHLLTVRGLSYFPTGPEGPVHHSPVSYEPDLDSLPMPAIDLFDIHKYDQFPLLSTRGCPFECMFCATRSVWGRTPRFHSVERVMREVRRAVETYGFRKLVFVDDTFVLDHDRVRRLCDALDDYDHSVTWSANARVDTITPTLAKRMYGAGCRVLSFGVESGSDLIQQQVKKRLDLQGAKNTLLACRESGIRIKTGWVIGLPGSKTEQLKSLDLMLELMPDEISIHHFIPIPGTAYWDEPWKYGISFDKDRLLRDFSIDALPQDIGVSLDYLSHDEAKTIADKMVGRLRAAGYRQPHEIDSTQSNPRVVNCYTDRARLPVLG